MTVEAFAKFSLCLQYRSPGNAPAWDEGAEEYYFVSLEGIPDEAAPFLMKAIMRGSLGKFRPDPDDILRLYETFNGNALLSADQLVTQLLTLRRRYGTFTTKHADGYFIEGEPRWTDIRLKRLSDARGGWVAFCAEETNETASAQLMNLARAIVMDQSTEVVNRIRLEYREQNAGLLESGALGLSEAETARGGFARLETQKPAIDVTRRQISFDGNTDI